MERIDYDPEGGDYKPVTEHETGSTFIVVGLIMLISGMGWLMFVGWDIRGGNHFMQALFYVDVLIALLLMVVGFIKKKRLIN